MHLTEVVIKQYQQKIGSQTLNMIYHWYTVYFSMEQSSYVVSRVIIHGWIRFQMNKWGKNKMFCKQRNRTGEIISIDSGNNPQV